MVLTNWSIIDNITEIKVKDIVNSKHIKPPHNQNDYIFIFLALEIQITFMIANLVQVNNLNNVYLFVINMRGGKKEIYKKVLLGR